MFQTGQCSRGAEPYLTARTAVGMHQSIHLVYRRPCFLSIKKEACKSLFLFCNSGIACLRVWIPTRQQYSQTCSIHWFGYLQNNSTLKRNEQWDKFKLIPKLILPPKKEVASILFFFCVCVNILIASGFDLTKCVHPLLAHFPAFDIPDIPLSLPLLA